MSHMVLIELLLKWSNWETTWNPLLGDSQYHRSTLKALKHINLFDYEILQGEFLFSSVGESWETLPYSKPKSTKSYTNKCLVFKGLCLLNGEVPSVFPQTWTLQGESESMHIRCWVWGAGAPLLYISKKGRNLGYSHSSSLSVCASWSETICSGSLGPSAAQHGVPMCVGGNWFLILLRQNSPSLHLPLGGLAAPLYRWEGKTVVTEYTELLLRSQEAWVQVLVLWPWES